jgi:hypothetical protein
MTAVLILSCIALMMPDANAGDQGFIYGKITTRDGDEYTGTMRWGKQEYFWDDIFNASKDDNPWIRYVPRERRKEHKGRQIIILGIPLDTDLASEHLFISRFGNIESIRPKRSGRTIVNMKNGSEYDLTGSGDINISVRMLDENLGKVNMKWKDIRKIEFMPTPKKAKTPGYRLRGTVKTYEMDFKGFIMWDAEECISTDVLDGDADEGDMEIEFGNIRSIKRLSSRACRVTLKDGREFDLRGSNDVNSSNRGIYVHDDRYGKIEVQWDEFKEIIYEDADDSGKPYDSYKPAKRLEGTVETEDGDEYKGKIVFDLDESEGFEILNGDIDEMEFYIPFGNIESITRKGRHASIVKLTNGEELRLEDSQDVSNKNDGILVFSDDNDEEYIDWEDVKKVTFK